MTDPANVEHIQYICTCRNQGCQFCDGGLFLCTVCDSFEGATTTSCPKRRMTKEEIADVYEGILDFRNGEWIKAPSGSCSSHYDGRPGLPEDIDRRKR